jgi:hypothetical protein
MKLMENEYEVYDLLLQDCMNLFNSAESPDVIEMAMRLMDRPCVPMHYPFHHFIVPAVLLTACMKVEGRQPQELEAALHEALKRSQNVLGGFCGLYGACGAAIGVGIFYSVFTDTTPMSVKSWAWCNAATAKCLEEISSVEGPRCCKRVVFMALKTALPDIKKNLNISLPEHGPIVCQYSERNKECKRTQCPFYHSSDAR